MMMESEQIGPLAKKGVDGGGGCELMRGRSQKLVWNQKLYFV